MRYYYYYYTHKLGFGWGLCKWGLCKSESTTFPLANSTKYVRENTEPSATISFWMEITYEECEEMSKIIDEYNDEQDTEEKD